MSSDPEYASLDPTQEEIREIGYQVIDRIVDHYGRVDEVPTLPDAEPAEVAQLFDDSLPRKGEDLERIIADWDDRVYPYAAHQGSPRWFGYVNGSGTPAGALADALAASVNMNVGGWLLGPSATEVERQCLRWLADMVGVSTDCGGVLTSGGTMANQAAIYAALQDATDYELRQTGFAGRPGSDRLTLYESAHEDHSSITRVAEVLGIGRESIRKVEVDEQYRMDVDDLRAKLEDDLAAGNTPFAVVAQVGSINVSAIDPLEEIASVCEEYDVWMHADGACGAVGAILPDKAHLYDGIERADSVTIDPHKWLSIPYSCGCVLFRDKRVQERAFSMEAAYLDVTEREEYQGTNFAFLGPEMSRPFRALKLWMTIKARGLDGYREQLSRGCRCAEHLHERVIAEDDLTVMQEPNLFIYSFQYLPADLQENSHSTAVEEYADWLNQRIADDLRLTGLAYVTTTTVAGRVVIRFSICSHRTTPADIDRTVDGILEHGERIDETDRAKRLTV